MRVRTTLLCLCLLGMPVHAQPVAVAAADSADHRAMERLEAHIKDMHGRLGITPAQEPQWQVFAAVMRQNAAAMEADYNERQRHLSGQTATEQMRSYAATSRLHADNMDRLLPPFEALYASMSPEQRAAADKTLQSLKRGPGRFGRS